MNIKIHKENRRGKRPVVSIILLDWSVRERFQALEWLQKQSVDRDIYELIWIELYDRVSDEAMEMGDVVITCSQTGMYHKHYGYNVGMLHSRGAIINISDSDAVFPHDFMESVLTCFKSDSLSEPYKPLVLMHYQWRTAVLYPDGLKDVSEMGNYKWADLWPNAGACMSVRKVDAIRFGAFDEDESLRGYMCGPYELGWRLVNAGIPEVWHDPKIALWHFSHPDPYATYGQRFSRKAWKEITHPHIDGHALAAVEAFCTGRLLPRRENPEVFRLRMSARHIGTAFEEKYSKCVGPESFSAFDIFKLKIKLFKQSIYLLFFKQH